MAPPIPSLPSSVYGVSPAKVVQLNTSDGGAPKLPVQQVQVTQEGISTDRQDDLKHHGGPTRALCLYAQEIIDALRAEGHPIVAGGAGENITTVGFDWTELVPGRRFRIGEVLAEFSEWAKPCSKIGACFEEMNFKRCSHKRNPGWGRAYAWVREGGLIVVGAPIVWEDRGCP